MKSQQSKNDVSSSGYEDSESETPEYSEDSNHQNDVLQNFLVDKGYKGLKVQRTVNLPHIDSDEEEIYLLRIPKSIDPNVLRNTRFSLNKTSKVKTQSGIYYMKPLADVPEPIFFVHSNGLKKICPVSMLQLEKFVETSVENKDTIEECEIQPAPSDLIPRHTIFGAKYLERIKLQEEIQQKLQEALQRFDKKKETTKRKKKQAVDSVDYDDKSLLISQILEAKFKDKKFNNSNEKSKKKAESSNSDMNKIEEIHETKSIKQDFQENSLNLLCSTPSEKKKKKKKETETENISIEIKEEVLSESEFCEPSPKKKGKKRNRDSDATFIAPEMIKQEFDDYFSAPAKKRKPSILSSTVITDGIPEFPLEVSAIERADIIKKKQKKSDTSDFSNITSDHTIEVKPDPDMINIVVEERTEKKKKKRKSLENSSQYDLTEQDCIDVKPTVSFLEDMESTKKKKKNKSIDEISQEITSDSKPYVDAEENKKRAEKKKKRRKNLDSSEQGT